MKTTHHIVYSTKGGCGKTVFSLLLAHCEHDFDNLINTTFIQDNFDEDLIKNWMNREKIIISRKNEKQPRKIRKINCFIDLDLLSSSLTYYLDSDSNINNSIKNEHITFQDLIEKNNQLNELKFMSCRQYGKKSIFIIPVDARQSKKEIFYVKRNNTPLLRYEEVTIFIEYIQKSLEKYLLSRGLDEYDQLNFIYDLPLNSDGYTEAILDEIFKLKEKERENNQVRLYLVANCVPMMNCNIDWLGSFFNTYREKVCDVVIVCNDNLECFKRVNKNLYKENIGGTIRTSLQEVIDSNLKLIECSSSIRKHIKYAVYIDKDDMSIESFSHNEETINGIKIYDLQERNE